MFVLFNHFDSDMDGHVHLGGLVDAVSTYNVERDSEADILNSSQESCSRHGSTDEATQPGQLFRAALLIQAEFLTREGDDLRTMFRMIDRDGSGTIDLVEFQKGVCRFNQRFSKPVSDAHSASIFSSIRKRHDEYITMQEFVDYFGVRAGTSVVHRCHVAGKPRTSSGLEEHHNDGLPCFIGDLTCSNLRILSIPLEGT
jgi:Ca2+-binding EF-hand superfamily protein